MDRGRPTAVVSRPRAEHHDVPIGIGEALPRLSWQVATEAADWVQDSYEIEVTDPVTGFTVRTDRIRSASSLLVPWPTAALPARARRQVRVRVWGPDEADAGTWSETLVLETGLLAAADWSARFVTPVREPATAPLLRREFVLPGPVRAARLYATALGVYELELNGRRVGDETLAPGWTSYPHRLRFQTYDVTELLQEGTNVLGGRLADGWFRGRLGFGGGTSNIYGDDVALLAQLEVGHPDGSSSTVVTDTRWQAAPGPLLSSSIYDGEHHDARLELPGWSSPGFDDSGWQPVRIVERDLATLVPPTGPPVRCTERLSPVSVTGTPSGRTVYDFGQNLVGRLRVTARGPAGSRVVLRHAEVLRDGELAVESLRTAQATDEYVLRDGGEQVWEPRFTFHGFRYAELRGDAEVADVVASVQHTDMRRTGEFHCSDPLVERLHENVVWSMRGNFLDVPTDCPQRDERLGWTGDLQIFLPTAAYLYDCAGMLRSWLRDLAAEQFPDGTVPLFTPLVPVRRWSDPRPTAAWGDAAVLVPWQLYQRFGDVEILREQYASARAWVERIAALAGPDHLWVGGEQLGDWLDPSAPAGDPGAVKADRDLVATAYYARSTAALAQMAALLGLADDRRRYDALARAVARAFERRWVQPNGRLPDDAQTSYALALRFDLVQHPQRRALAGRRLSELVRENGFRLDTGFVGTPLICDALTEAGYLDTAYALLTQQEYPSWLYAVTQGATTVWERWDSVRPDGTLNPSKTNSLNHYALGAVADWLHRTVAGLAPAQPGYRQLLVRPQPGGGLTWASTAHETPYGRAAVEWRIEAGSMVVDLEVPVGTTARVQLPGEPEAVVGPGRHRRTASRPQRAMSGVISGTTVRPTA